jgi:hypothetical protein
MFAADDTNLKTLTPEEPVIHTREDLGRLSDRVNKLPRKTSIILCCGCCRWNHCPNISPAYEAIARMGFTNIKVLCIANNFGTDCVR